MTKTEQLDKLFDLWKATKEEYKNNFAKDGIINELYWDKAKIKVLIILKDTNDYSGDLRQIIDQKPWIDLGRWSYGIQNTTTISIPDFYEAENNYKDYCKYLSVLNLKKSSGGATANNSEVEQAAILDKDFILDEIKIINPEIIICGGVIEIVNKIFPTLRHSHERKYTLEEITVIDFIHPSQRSVRRDMIYYYLCTLFKKYKNN